MLALTPIIVSVKLTKVHGEDARQIAPQNQMNAPHIAQVKPADRETVAVEPAATQADVIIALPQVIVFVRYTEVANRIPTADIVHTDPAKPHLPVQVLLPLLAEQALSVRKLQFQEL